MLALLIFPIVANLTHGPFAHGASAWNINAHATPAITGGHDQGHGHGHDHGHDNGHSHSHDHQADTDERLGGAFAGHNAADHDHQFHALACHADGTLLPVPDNAPCAVNRDFRHLTPDGLKRPPRLA